MAHTAAVILDGGFLKKKLQEVLNKFPSSDDVVAFVEATMQKPRLVDAELFRVFYYDAPPFVRSGDEPTGWVRPQLLRNPAGPTEPTVDR